MFPVDHLDTHGNPFWSGPKRAPSHLTFDSNDELHFNFVVSCANLVAFNLKMEGCSDVAKLKAMCQASTPGVYVAKRIKVQTEEKKEGEEQKKEEPEPEQDEEEVLAQLLSQLSLDQQSIKPNHVEAAEFEKD